MSPDKLKRTDKIIEYGVYAYIFLSFLAKGEGIRNILIFGGFVLWLMTLKYRKNLFLLKEPVSKWCWVYLGSVLISVMFSIDPLYSLNALRDDPLKFACLFPVITTVMSDEEKLKKAVHVSFFTLVLIVVVAYYSYIVYDLEILRPHSILIHAWYNRFARYLCMLIPISFTLYFIWKKRALKVILTISLVFSVFALILSTTRTGYAAFIVIILIWSFYFSKKTGINVKKATAVMLAVLMISGVSAYFFVPDVNKRINLLSSQIYDLNERTQIWRSAGYAIRQRPVVGWGYGEGLFHHEEPYKNTPYQQPPVKGPHNILIDILFHQGITGVIPYIALILTAVTTFWKTALDSAGIKSYVLVAGVSILVGNYILQNMLSPSEFHHLAVLLGLGVAATGIHEKSISQ